MLTLSKSKILDRRPCPYCGNEIMGMKCRSCGKEFSIRRAEKSFLTTDVQKMPFKKPEKYYEIRKIRKRLDKMANEMFEQDVPAKFFATYDNLIRGYASIKSICYAMSLDPTEDAIRIRHEMPKAEVDLVERNLKGIADERDAELFYFMFIPYVQDFEDEPLAILNQAFEKYGFKHDFVNERRKNGWSLDQKEFQTPEEKETERLAEEAERERVRIEKERVRIEKERIRLEEEARIWAERRKWERILQEEEERRKAEEKERERIRKEEEKRKLEEERERRRKLQRKIFGLKQNCDDAKNLLGTKMISSEEFLEKWEELKRTDGSGCYVICSYGDGNVEDYTNYHDVYVGQSKTVFKRVRNHLTGHGNGDVYCDVRNGEKVYVKIVKCELSELNVLEKRLITTFEALKSYNKTAGGSASQTSNDAEDDLVCAKIDLSETILKELSNVKEENRTYDRNEQFKQLNFTTDEARRVKRTPPERSERVLHTDRFTEEFLTKCSSMLTARQIREEAKKRLKRNPSFLSPETLERLNALVFEEGMRWSMKNEALEMLADYFSETSGKETG